MNIEQDIAAWDEKSASDIAAIYEAYHQQSSFADTIVELVPIDTFQNPCLNSQLLMAMVINQVRLTTRITSSGDVLPAATLSAPLTFSGTIPSRTAVSNNS